MNTDPSSIDRKWMSRALELAKQGQGKVSPNPMVGAVVVKDGSKISEGFHAEYGMAHAEQVAIEEAGNAAKGSTIYVNLEPCTFTGNTPPCTETIINAGISRVVAAMPDPNPKVRGNGFEQLRNEGIQVDMGLMREQAVYLNRRFVTFHMEGRPFIIAKWAMSLDGKIATRTGDSQWITSREARRRARSLRTDAGAVMVGIGTVIEDNPTLLGPDNESTDPIRIIVDSKLRITPDYDIVQTADRTRTIIATTHLAPENKIQQLEDTGLEILKIDTNDRQVDFDALCLRLAEMDIQAVLVEGGGTLLASAFEQGVVGDVKVFVSPKIIGGSQATTPVEGEGIKKVSEAPELSNVRTECIEPDVLIEASYQEPSDFDV